MLESSSSALSGSFLVSSFPPANEQYYEQMIGPRKAI